MEGVKISLDLYSTTALGCAVSNCKWLPEIFYWWLLWTTVDFKIDISSVILVTS